MAGVKFWLDSANLEDIRWADKSGFVTGVTVNQSLIAKEEKQDLHEFLKAIFGAARPDLGLALSLPAIGIEAAEIEHHALGLAEEFGDSIYIKVPVSRDTLPLIATLALRQVHVNATCIFTGLQAALAAAAGAEILSVFVGRINDEQAGWGWKVIEAARGVCGDAEVLAGSIRDKMMVAAAIDHGAHIVTTSRKVLETLAEERGTAMSVAKFDADIDAWMA